MKLSRQTTFPLIAAMMLFGPYAFSESAVIQKWVDAQGHVHFGDMPPPDAKTTDVTVKYTPVGENRAPKAAPASGGAASTSKPGTVLDDFTKSRQAREAKEAKEAEEENRRKLIEGNAARIRAEACQRQRAGLLKNQITSNKDECS
jgi:hypothetical protein